MVDMRDYRTAGFDRTFDCYDHVDCHNYMDLHDYLKFAKHGYSKVTDHASREIRHGRLTRAQGEAFVAEYQSALISDRDLFCDWLGVEERSSDFIINQHRNPSCWNMCGSTEWEFSGGCSTSVDHQKADGCITFTRNDSMEYRGNRGYVTVGKGFQ